jgi:hypothetical protein
MPVATYVTSRASHARQVKGDRSDQKGYHGTPGWGLGHEADYLIPIKTYTVRKPWMTASVIKEAKAHKGV